MKIYVTVFVILFSTYVVHASLLEPVVENIVHYEAKQPPHDVHGIWRKKTIWKPRWVKEWKSSKVMKPVWRKVWSPVHIKEWVPIPKPPPGWETKSTRLIPVKTETDKIPFWDPMPYPESQQPPPPSQQPPEPSQEPLPPQNFDNQCGGGGCGDFLIQTFTQEQIAKIIGSHRHKKAPDYPHSGDDSEMMTQLVKVPTDSENWRIPRQSPLHENRFNLLPEPSQYLVPPKYQSFATDFPSHLRPPSHLNHKKVLPQPTFHSSTAKPHKPRMPTNHANSVKHMGGNQWAPIQSQKQVNHQNPTHGKPSNPVNKYQAPHNNHHAGGKQAANQKKPNPIANGMLQNQNVNVKNNHPTTAKPNFQVNSDLIQQADLIGEYHYSDFDFYSTVKPNTNSNIKQESMFKPLNSNIKQESMLKPLNSNIKQENMFKPLNSITNNQSFVPMKFKPLPKETLSTLLQETISNLRSAPTTTLPKFKPLVPETASPQFAENMKQIKQQLMSQNVTKPRPTRKDPDFLQPDNEVQRFTPKPEIIFEQQKAITKEILPFQESTPNPFPVNHRFAPNPALKSSNATRPTNFEQIDNVEKKFHLYFVYPEGQSKNSKNDSEENLLKALKKSPVNDVRTNNITEVVRVETTTEVLQSTTSTSTSTGSKTEVATKSPVFIVTPTYVEKA